MLHLPFSDLPLKKCPNSYFSMLLPQEAGKTSSMSSKCPTRAWRFPTKQRGLMERSKNQERKSSPKTMFLGGIFLGHQGPRRRDIPDKNLMQVAFFCCFRHGVAGMSRDLGRDVQDLEKLYERELWADFSFPKKRSKIGWIQEGFKTFFCRTAKIRFRHLFGAIFFRFWGSIQL